MADHVDAALLEAERQRAREGDARRLRELGALNQRIGELEGALTGLLDQAARNELMLVLSEDQYQRIRSLVDREEVRDGE